MGRLLVARAGGHGLNFLKTLASKLGAVLAVYGGWGLLAISALDSSVVPMPGVNDFLLIHLSARFPLRMPLYVLGATIGSVLGAYAVFALGYGGRRAVRRRAKPESSGRVRRWLEQNDFLSVLVISLLPPPAPFKLFLMAGGAMRVRPWRFGLALLLGRGLRFGIEGLLAVRYGEQAETYLKNHFVGASLVLVGAAVLFYLVFRIIRKSTLPAADTDASRRP
jgi:membrane protein YqaA with SNARE-associated domain